MLILKPKKLKLVKQDKTSLKKELDKLWRQAGLLKYGNKCEFNGCNKTQYLNAHHFFSRSRTSTRWDLENCMILCPLHHSLGTESAHKDPSFKDKVLGKIRGYTAIRSDNWYTLLERRANTPQKTDLVLERLYLLNEIKRS